jgi:hypothetical protein
MYTIFYVALLQLLNMHVQHLSCNTETQSRNVLWDSIWGLWNSNKQCNGSRCWIDTSLAFTQALAYTSIWSLLQLLKDHYHSPVPILKPCPCLQMLYLLMQLPTVFRNKSRSKKLLWMTVRWNQDTINIRRISGNFPPNVSLWRKPKINYNAMSIQVWRS